MKSKQETKKNVPALRFPGFKGQWDCKKISQVLKKTTNPVNVLPDEYYKQIGIRSHGKGIFHKEPVDGKSLGNKRVFWVQQNSFVVNIVFAWEQAVAVTSSKEKGMIASHRFPMYQPLDNKSNVVYLLHFFLTDKGKSLLELASPGGAGRNKTLGQKEFENLSFAIPSIDEQQKIASFLSAIDERLQQLHQQQSLLEQYKKSCMQQLFSQQLRFKDDRGKAFLDWQEKSLGELLDYLQPTKYIVTTTEYHNAFNIPVLTAGKTFILGFTNETSGIFKEPLPVIIFDDFTTANHFVDFPFKVKSSAIKILLPANEKVNIKFVYEAIQLITFSPGDEHKRYWISEYSRVKIRIPSLEEQTKIANFLFAIDEQINTVKQQITQTQKFKKGLLQQMFV